MTFMDTTSIILKTDSRGRVRMPPQRREELLMEFERSGLPATKFAALAGVRYQTFATWCKSIKSGALQRSPPLVPCRCVLPRWFQPQSLP